jgi:hypothetical protein
MVEESLQPIDFDSTFASHRPTRAKCLSLPSCSKTHHTIRQTASFGHRQKEDLLGYSTCLLFASCVTTGPLHSQTCINPLDIRSILTFLKTFPADSTFESSTSCKTQWRGPPYHKLLSSPCSTLISARSTFNGVAAEEEKYEGVVRTLGGKIRTVAGEGDVSHLILGMRLQESGPNTPPMIYDHLLSTFQDVDRVWILNLCSLPYNRRAADLVVPNC